MLVTLSREGVVFLVLLSSFHFTRIHVLPPPVSEANWRFLFRPGGLPPTPSKMASSFTGSAHSPFPEYDTITSRQLEAYYRSYFISTLYSKMWRIFDFNGESTECPGHRSSNVNQHFRRLAGLWQRYFQDSANCESVFSPTELVVNCVRSGLAGKNHEKFSINQQSFQQHSTTLRQCLLWISCLQSSNDTVTINNCGIVEVIVIFTEKQFLKQYSILKIQYLNLNTFERNTFYQLEINTESGLSERPRFYSGISAYTYVDKS